MIILDSTLVMMILPIILKPKWGGGGGVLYDVRDKHFD